MQSSQDEVRLDEGGCLIRRGKFAHRGPDTGERSACRVYKPRSDRVADNFIELRKRPGTDPALEPPEAANPADALVSDFWLPVQGE